MTGAAYDDPSGIATYSIAGAQFGTAFLWTALATWPLILTIGLTLHRAGITNPKTAREVASALVPLGWPFRIVALYDRVGRHGRIGDSDARRLGVVRVRGCVRLAARNGRAFPARPLLVRAGVAATTVVMIGAAVMMFR
ncbi:MAG TPA: hypothetical protein VGH04_02065 [Gemmatimonadaceae bacterium]